MGGLGAAPHHDLRVDVATTNGTGVVTVAGDVDINSCRSLREELIRLIEDGVTTVVLDLAHMDFVDSTGRLLGAGPAAPAGSAYLRRWSVDSLPGSISHTSVLQVLVADLRGRSLARFVAAKAGRQP